LPQKQSSPQPHKSREICAGKKQALCVDYLKLMKKRPGEVAA
jgi:hypothetical protein